MARIRYQPATKTKGFRPIQLSSAGISRMREETNRVVQGMEKNLAAEQRQRQENLKAMKDDAAYTERITKENRDIEVQNLKNEQLSITQTADRDAQQAKYDADATETILSSLVDFSATLQKTRAKNKAAQLKGQLEAVAAADPTSYSQLLSESYEEYKQGEELQMKGALQLGTEIRIESAQSGVRFSKHLKNLMSNSGIGAVGKKPLLNEVFGDVHNILERKALASTEKLYTDGSGNKFSGFEALSDPEQLAIVQSELIKNVSSFMLDTHGISESQYFEPIRTKLKAANDIKGERAQVKAEQFNSEVIKQQLNDVAKGGTTAHYTIAYTETLENFGPEAAKTFITNQISVATDDQIKAIEAVETNDGRTIGERFLTNIVGPAKQARAEKIYRTSVNNEQIAKKQYVDGRTAVRDDLLGKLIESAGTPAEFEANVAYIIKTDAENGAQMDPVLANQIKIIRAGLVNQETAEIMKRTANDNLTPSFLFNIQDSANKTLALENKKQLELTKNGGEEGANIIAGYAGDSRTMAKINGENGNSQSAQVKGALEFSFKKALAANGGNVKAAAQTVQAEKDKANHNDQNIAKQSLFYRKNKGNRVVFPNIENPSDDKLEAALNYNSTLLEKGIRIVETPDVLGTQEQLTAFHRTKGQRNPPPFIAQTARDTGKDIVEVYNGYQETMNKEYGTSYPLITPSLFTKVLQEVDPETAKLLSSDNLMKFTRGARQATGTTSADLRPTFKSTPSGQSTGVRGRIASRGDADGQDTGLNIELFGPKGLTEKIGDHQSETGAYGNRGVPISIPYELTFNEIVPGGRNAGARSITTQGSSDRVVKGTAPSAFGHIGSYTYTDENGDQYEIMLAHGDQPFNSFNEGQTIPAGTVLGYQGASGSTADGTGGGFDMTNLNVNSYGNGDPNIILERIANGMINQN